MAVGDTVSYGAYNVANNGTTDIQPGSGVEVLIHTIETQATKSMEIYRTSDGTNFILLETITQSAHGLTFRATNTFWLRLKNVSGGTAGNFAEGVQTK